MSAIREALTLFGGIFMILMQLGFSMLEAGHQHATSAQNLLLKNILDIMLVSVIWFAVGYAFAFGDSSSTGGFIGLSHFFLEGADTGSVFVQWAFATNATTIFGGSVAGRQRFMAYVGISLALGGLIYPVAAQWVWGEHGWLRKLGFVDCSGSGVVHMVGGITGLAGAMLVGPRIEIRPRRPDAALLETVPHSSVLVVEGGLLLYSGWFAFNACGALLADDDHLFPLATRAVLNTLLSSAAASLTSFLGRRLMGYPTYSLAKFANAMLAGLVAITAPCAVVPMWTALPIGVVAALLQGYSASLCRRWHIDDPLEAISVHVVAGAWGLLATGLFATKEDVEFILTGHATLVPEGEIGYGLFLGGGWRFFGMQLLGTVLLSLWSFLLSYIVFYAMARQGALRVSLEAEVAGLDINKHDAHAYPEFVHATPKPPLDYSMITNSASHPPWTRTLCNLLFCQSPPSPPTPPPPTPSSSSSSSSHSSHTATTSAAAPRASATRSRRKRHKLRTTPGAGATAAPEESSNELGLSRTKEDVEEGQLTSGRRQFGMNVMLDLFRGGAGESAASGVGGVPPTIFETSETSTSSSSNKKKDLTRRRREEMEDEDKEDEEDEEEGEGGSEAMVGSEEVESSSGEEGESEGGEPRFPYAAAPLRGYAAVTRTPMTSQAYPATAPQPVYLVAPDGQTIGPFYPAAAPYQAPYQPPTYPHPHPHAHPHPHPHPHPYAVPIPPTHPQAQRREEDAEEEEVREEERVEIDMDSISSSEKQAATESA